MTNSANYITANILEKEYRVACPADCTEALMQAAKYLDKHMRTIRHSGRIIGAERIAVMAAINISYELLSMKDASNNQHIEGLSDRLLELQNKIDDALNSAAKENSSDDAKEAKSTDKEIEFELEI